MNGLIAIYKFCIPLKLTTFVCSNAIDNFGCSTSMETFWVHYYIWKYLPATIKLTTDRPMKGLTDRLTDIVTYIVAIASKNIQFFSWGWGSVTKQLSLFLFYFISNIIVLKYFLVNIENYLQIKWLAEEGQRREKKLSKTVIKEELGSIIFWQKRKEEKQREG